ALPGDARRLQPLADLPEEVLGFARKELVDLRRVGGERLVARVLAVEDAQRVAFETVLAVFAERGLVIAEVADQRLPPGFAARRVAERVQLQRHAVRDAELFQELV